MFFCKYNQKILTSAAISISSLGSSSGTGSARRGACPCKRLIIETFTILLRITNPLTIHIGIANPDERMKA